MKKNTIVSRNINKKYYLFIIILVVFFLTIILRLTNMQIVNNDLYLDKLREASVILVDGPSTPRGRIYDRNGKLIVDNIAIKTIYYKKKKNVSVDEEIRMSKIIANNIDIDYSKLSVDEIKKYWILTHKKESSLKLLSSEKEDYKNRKLSDKDIMNIKISRVTDEDISIYKDIEKKSIYIYYLMNDGYSYDEKIIKNNGVSDIEYAFIATNTDKIPGFGIRLDWDRLYLYGDTFKSMLGKVSNKGIPFELKNEYLSKGYLLTDRVGVSYIEKQYEDYLKGKKEKYRLTNNNEYILVEDGLRGNDLYLTIDIDLQKKVDDIITSEMIKAKMEANTRYFNKLFVVVSDPQTGEILAISGKQILWNDSTKSYYFTDLTPGVLTSPITVGSVVKGASLSVGYKTGAIDIGTTFYDSCIKLSGVKEKCSWSKSLGTLNDIGAIRMSSNSYQFRTALLVAGVNYWYNVNANIESKYFDLYRNTFAEYGLGVKTDIDLPVESTGYKGKKEDAGLYLNFSIGQYDSYTPIQLSQYINTIANGGRRLKMQLLKNVKSSIDSSDVFNYSPVELNKVNLEDKYLDRIKQAFRAVMVDGLGRGFMGVAPSPAGKTGTSESFYDSNLDGVIDTPTITKSFVGYAPSEEAKMSIVVIAPDISIPDSGYISNIHKRISSQISNYFFGTN